MPYIPLEKHLPGITALLEYSKDTASPIRELTQILLRGPSTLTEGERELIATVVSSRNECKFWTAEGIPGIRSLVLFRPETGKPLYELAQVLLRGLSPLTEAERELIAAYVSYRNDCMFCMNSHAAAARCLYGEEKNIVDDVLNDMQRSGVTNKMKALLNIAGKVQILGKEVMPEDIAAARALGADDREIHDTVLIAASFSMFNRYVDGLASFTPADPAIYEEMGKRMAKRYVLPQQTK